MHLTRWRRWMSVRRITFRPFPSGRSLALWVSSPLLVMLVATVGCSPKTVGHSDDAAATGKKTSRPNIILLTVESLRADHIGCYGYERATTPNLDALAQIATRYSDANAVSSWTLASHATIFTGLYPTAHGATRPKSKLADVHVTLAESLRAAGYQTAASVSGPYLRKAHNLHQGFERYDDSPITPTDKSASKDVTNPAMEASLAEFLDKHRDGDKPFFLFGYFWDPHSHYIPPPPFNTMFVPADAEPIEPKRIHYAPFFKLGVHISPAQLRYQIAQYDGEIRCTDAALGRLFQHLRKLNLWDNTAIIITSDHGEEFYDHGHNSHKNTLYVESLHVPLVIKWPGRQPHAVDDRIVNLIDLYPTILELAGVAPVTLGGGQSLRKPAQPNRSTFYELLTLWTFTRKSTGERWQESDQWYAVRRGHHKLINIATKGVWELYDVQADPHEQHPLGESQPEILGELQGELETWQEAMRLLASRGKPGVARLSKEEERRLRDLGYLP